MDIIEQLRGWANSIRRKPAPLSDAIPMVCNAADEIESLRQQLNDADESEKAVEKALDDVDYRGSYADGVLYLKQQLAAALAAIEAKDAALNELTDLMCESYGITGFHLNGDVAPWSEVEEGGRFERLTSLNGALATKPDASALKAHDEALIERVASEFVDSPHAEMFRQDIVAAIRELKGNL